jgi:hypothetical protein
MGTGTSSGDSSMALRRWLLALLVFGLTATTVDLYLLAHYEDSKQLIPFVVLAGSLTVIAWHVASGTAASLRVLQLTMLLLVIAGGVGVVLHFRGNMEFQLEIDPSMSGFALFNKVMHAKAPPAMAPGAMTQFGLLGLLYSYRHPVLAYRQPTAPGEHS